MATTKLYLDKRSVRKDGTTPLKVSVSHKGKTALISLNVFLTEKQWDEKAGKVILHPNKAFLNTFITRRKLDIDTILLRLSEEGRLGALGISGIKETIEKELNPEDVQERKGVFIDAFKKSIELKNKPRTKEIYKITLSRMRKFCDNLDDLNFEDITKEWLIAFDNFLAETSPSRNARNIHLRNIRAVFNEAIDNEITTFYPFRKFKIKNEETMKRSLSVEQLRKLFNYPVEEHQRQYLDMFKLIFCLIGINTVDLFNLTEKNVEIDRIIYHRAKTNRLYDIKIEPEAASIIERYKGRNYLLNVLDRYGNYRDYVKRLNDNLQLIGEVKAGKQGKKSYKPLFPKLTTYWARHSWATIAASLDIPKETIAAALGHEIGNSITSIYISFDKKKVDEANRRVLDWVFYKK